MLLITVFQFSFIQTLNTFCSIHALTVFNLRNYQYLNIVINFAVYAHCHHWTALLTLKVTGCSQSFDFPIVTWLPSVRWWQKHQYACLLVVRNRLMKMLAETTNISNCFLNCVLAGLIIKKCVKKYSRLERESFICSQTMIWIGLNCKVSTSVYLRV